MSFPVVADKANVPMHPELYSILDEVVEMEMQNFPSQLEDSRQKIRDANDRLALLAQGALGWSRP